MGTKEPSPQPSPGSLPSGGSCCVEEHYERLRQALHRTVTEARATQPRLSSRRLSRALGRHPEYLGKSLRGAGKLRVNEVCEVLQRIGLDPASFFLLTFPVGGVAENRLRGRQPAGSRALPLEDLEAPLRQLTRRQTPEYWLKRSRDLLRQYIRRSPFTQQQLSTALGFRSPRALSMILWGKTALSYRYMPLRRPLTF